MRKVKKDLPLPEGIRAIIDAKVSLTTESELEIVRRFNRKQNLSVELGENDLRLQQIGDALATLKKLWKHTNERSRKLRKKIDRLQRECSHVFTNELCETDICAICGVRLDVWKLRR